MGLPQGLGFPLVEQVLGNAQGLSDRTDALPQPDELECLLLELGIIFTFWRPLGLAFVRVRGCFLVTHVVSS